MEFSETSGKIIDGRIEFSVPLTKVDEEKRMVHGFATLDNIDLEGDIVPLETSVKAFQKFRGNLREMHNKHKAAGRVVTFRPERYFDPKTNKVYNGVFVSAYVSKGAEDTWQKVLDKTLTGFSIGGVIVKSSDKIVSDGGIFRVIEEFFMTELSLVDNPCNQLANILSLEKSSDGGFLADTVVENVFWCKKDNTVQLSSSESTSCFHCDSTMQNIGFVESNDDSKMEVVKALIASAKYIPQEGDMVEFGEGFGVVEKVISQGKVKLDTEEDLIEATENDPVAVVNLYTQNNDTMVTVNRRILKNVSSITKKEVENMSNAETEVTVVEEVVEKSVDESLGAPQVFDGEPSETSEETAVDADKVSEEEVAEEPAEEEAEVQGEEVEKSADLAELKAMVKGLTDALAPLGELIKSFGASAQENRAAIEKVSSDLQSAKDEIFAATNEFGKRVEAVEGKTAFQKSADLGEIRQHQPEVPATQSKWAGRFLDATYFD